ncbi:MAG: winged helix-turn-helix domain-containing protein [Faecalibacillus faecis]
MQEVWHEDYCIDTQTVTVHIKNIRKKIKKSIPQHQPLKQFGE